MEDNTVSIDEIKKFAFWMSSRFSDEAYEFGLTDKEEEPKLPEWFNYEKIPIERPLTGKELVELAGDARIDIDSPADKFGIGRLSLEDTDGKRYEASTDFTEGTVKTSDKKSITYERNFHKDEYTFFDHSGDKPFSFSTEYIDGNDDVAEDAREIAGIVFNKGGYDPGALSEALDAHYNPTPDEDGSITYPSITSAYEEISVSKDGDHDRSEMNDKLIPPFLKIAPEDVFVLLDNKLGDALEKYKEEVAEVLAKDPYALMSFGSKDKHFKEHHDIYKEALKKIAAQDRVAGSHENGLDKLFLAERNDTVVTSYDMYPFYHDEELMGIVNDAYGFDIMKPLTLTIEKAMNEWAIETYDRSTGESIHEAAQKTTLLKDERDGDRYLLTINCGHEYSVPKIIKNPSPTDIKIAFTPHYDWDIHQMCDFKSTFETGCKTVDEFIDFYSHDIQNMFSYPSEELNASRGTEHDIIDMMFYNETSPDLIHGGEWDDVWKNASDKFLSVAIDYDPRTIKSMTEEQLDRHIKELQNAVIIDPYLYWCTPDKYTDNQEFNKTVISGIIEKNREEGREPSEGLDSIFGNGPEEVDERKKEEINELIAPFMNPERATEDNSRVADRFPADFDAALSAAEDKANVDNESLMSDADTKNEPEEVK